MLFQNGAHFHQLGVSLRHFSLKLRDGLRSAHTGDDVLALRVDEKLAVKFVDAVGWIAGEGHAGAGIIAGVAIDHRLHVDSGAPLGGDVVFAAIDDRAVIHPGAEHSAGGAAKLIPRAVREALASALFDEGLEALHQLLLVGGGEVAVHDVLAIDLMFVAFDDGFKRLVVFALALLHAEHHVAIHLHKAAVAVPGEALVVRGAGEGEDGLVVEAKVEDGVHHARHGVARAGADGDEERHALGVAKFAGHDLLHLGDAFLHLLLEIGGVAALVGIIKRADLGGDREPWRNRQADAAHLREVGAFAAEQRFHGAITICFSCSEGIDVLHCLAAAVARFFCHRGLFFVIGLVVLVVMLSGDGTDICLRIIGCKHLLTIES